MPFARRAMLAMAFTTVGCSLAAAQGMNPLAKTSPFTGDQTVGIEAIIAQWVAKNPKSIQAAMAANVASDGDLAADPLDWVFGNPTGDVTIVAFIDRDAPAAGNAIMALASMGAGDAGVRMVVKELPLLGAGSLSASLAALAARRQGTPAGTFEERLARLPRPVTAAALATAAVDAGLDAAKLAQDAADPDLMAYLRRVRADADQIGLKGTPAFLIGPKVLLGLQSPGVLVAAVAAERTRVGK